MTLTPGTRLGPYDVSDQIGVGGMGEVYRATDTNLGRQVAIKVLPDTFLHDPERLARFEREARTLASLNHPNIAIIYGLEKSNGIRALVMELVEGPTLADRISEGPIAIEEALPIAKQIADALEAAHEQGIIHRDLKPANVKVRPDGTVKVLDFGLAKALEPAGATSPSVAQSPTITSPAMMTGVGVLLGTAAYMSPEQARGKAVDKRTDVWAFGAVLYEMLTGTRAFPGDEVSDVLASVLAREPDWSKLPAGLSPVVANYIKRCLHKDRKQRIRDIGDVSLALDGAFGPGAPRVAPPLAVTGPVWRRALPAALRPAPPIPHCLDHRSNRLDDELGFVAGNRMIGPRGDHRHERVESASKSCCSWRWIESPGPALDPAVSTTSGMSSGRRLAATSFSLFGHAISSS